MGAAGRHAFQWCHCPLAPRLAAARSLSQARTESIRHPSTPLPRRNLTQGVKQRAWEEVPQLDPPPVLAQVVLVLVGPKNPANVGTIARSCSAFELLQLRVVESRCEHTAR